MDAKAAGRLVVGSFCVFVPEEIILALNGVSIGLCAGAEFGFDLAEQMLPQLRTRIEAFVEQIKASK